MLTSLKNIFIKDKSNCITDHHCKVELKETIYLFSLKYQTSEMGILKYVNNVWSFTYSEWFKSQNELQPLLEFPDKEKVYQCKDLWPFFTDRIPSFKQPKIKTYIEKHPEQRSNLAKLLEVFGEYSVNNPFRLETK